MGKFEAGHKKLGGRIKNVESFKEIAERVLVEMAQKDPKHAGLMISGKELTIRVLISKVMRGDLAAFMQLWNRLEGQPAQTIINQGGGGGLNIRLTKDGDVGASDSLNIEKRDERVEPEAGADIDPTKG